MDMIKKQDNDPLGTPFLVQRYGKKELANQYFPNSSPGRARDHVRDWLKKDPEFYDRLLRMGLSPHAQEWTAAQVQAIVNKIGPPY